MFRFFSAGVWPYARDVVNVSHLLQHIGRATCVGYSWSNPQSVSQRRQCFVPCPPVTTQTERIAGQSVLHYKQRRNFTWKICTTALSAAYWSVILRLLRHVKNCSRLVQRLYNSLEVVQHSLLLSLNWCVRHECNNTCMSKDTKPISRGQFILLSKT